MLGDAVGIECRGGRDIGADPLFGLNDARRYAHRSCPSGHWLDDHGVAADLGVVAHLEAAGKPKLSVFANDTISAQTATTSSVAPTKST